MDNVYYHRCMFCKEKPKHQTVAHSVARYCFVECDWCGARGGACTTEKEAIDEWNSVLETYWIGASEERK